MKRRSDTHGVVIRFTDAEFAALAKAAESMHPGICPTCGRSHGRRSGITGVVRLAVSKFLEAGPGKVG